jgi:hypothetical protein
MNYLFGKNYYLGEVLSDYNYSSAKFNYEVEEIDDFISDSLLIKIGNFLYWPEGNDVESNLQITSNGELTSYDLNFTVRNARSEDSSIPSGGNSAISKISNNSIFCIPSYSATEKSYNVSGDRANI